MIIQLAIFVGVPVLTFIWCTRLDARHAQVVIAMMVSVLLIVGGTMLAIGWDR